MVLKRERNLCANVFKLLRKKPSFVSCSRCSIYVKKERQSLKAIRKLNLLTPVLQCGIMDRNNTKTVAVESSQRYKMLTRYEAEILRAAVPDVLGRAGTGI